MVGVGITGVAVAVSVAVGVEVIVGVGGSVGVGVNVSVGTGVDVGGLVGTGVLVGVGVNTAQVPEPVHAARNTGVQLRPQLPPTGTKHEVIGTLHWQQSPAPGVGVGVGVRVGVRVGVMLGVGVSVAQLPSAHAALNTGMQPTSH